MIGLIMILVIFTMITLTIISLDRIAAKKRKLLKLGCIFLLVILIVFIPAPTQELAVKRFLFMNFPFQYFTMHIHKNEYGYLYIVPEIERSFIWVKRNKIGWYISSSGTGP